MSTSLEEEQRRVFLQYRSELGDHYAEVLLEDQRAEPIPVPWVFRANESLGGMIGVTSPPAYGEPELPPGVEITSVEKVDDEYEVPSKEKLSLCRTICEIIVWLTAFAIAGAWYTFSRHC
jgi:hypothetical protein